MLRPATFFALALSLSAVGLGGCAADADPFDDEAVDDDGEDEGVLSQALTGKDTIRNCKLRAAPGFTVIDTRNMTCKAAKKVWAFNAGDEQNTGEKFYFDDPKIQGGTWGCKRTVVGAEALSGIYRCWIGSFNDADKAFRVRFKL